MRYTSIDELMQPIEDTYRASHGLPKLETAMKLYHEPTETDPGCLTAEGERKVDEVFDRLRADKDYDHLSDEALWQEAMDHVLNDGD